MTIKSVLRYLNTSTAASLESFELARLNARSNVKKKLTLVLAEYLEEEATACLARLLMSRTERVNSRLLSGDAAASPDEIEEIRSADLVRDSRLPPLTNLSKTRKRGIAAMRGQRRLDRVALFVFTPPSTLRPANQRRPLDQPRNQPARSIRLSRSPNRNFVANTPRPILSSCHLKLQTCPPVLVRARDPSFPGFRHHQSCLAADHRRQRRSLLVTWREHRC
jgi:hypothetical protein